MAPATLVLNDFSDNVIWIIGASSGIGEALAKALHPLGVKLILSARRLDKLQALNQQLGNRHHCLALDISDAEAVAQATQTAIEYQGFIDRLIVLSSVYYPQSLSELNLEQVRKTVDVNLMGIFHVIYSVMPHFRRRNQGQLAICGSVSGYCGLPNGQPYSASKAAVINLCESLRAETGDSINIKVINPGFVKTPMTDTNDFKMPMMISAQQAATTIIKDLQHLDFESHFPKRFTLMVKLLQNLPYALMLRLTKKLNKKN